MSVFADISAALDEHLSLMPSLPPVAWENLDYTPELGTLYLRPTLLPAETIQSTLGENGTDQNTGIYQVDVFAPLGQGKQEAMSIADKIANHFKRGTDLTYNNRKLRIRNTGREVSTTEVNGWYSIPVTMTYISFTEART